MHAQNSTPVLNPTTPGEHNYNTAHIQTRNCIDRCWKRRFACLTLGLRTKLGTTLSIIIATAVLHNIAVHQNEPDYFEDIELNGQVEEEINFVDNAGGNAKRTGLINTVFR